MECLRFVEFENRCQKSCCMFWNMFYIFSKKALFWDIRNCKINSSFGYFENNQMDHFSWATFYKESPWYGDTFWSLLDSFENEIWTFSMKSLKKIFRTKLSCNDQWCDWQMFSFLMSQKYIFAMRRRKYNECCTLIIHY
jgi:hypothetical protein